MRVIAIDGPAGSGKSTVAKAVAERVGLPYLDTGAMYRSVAFAVLRGGGDPVDADLAAATARAIELEVSLDTVTVNGVDATLEIRGPEVTRAVSLVAANPEVRTEMVSRQREWVERRGGGVLEGRDIGTVVFPDAELKVYLTADPEERARRRAKEVTDLDYETVAADLARRDALDTSRDVDPLTEAADAVMVDTTGLSIDEVVTEIAALLGDGTAVVNDQTRPRVVYGSQEGDSPRRSRHGLIGRIMYRPFWLTVYALCKIILRLRVEGRENLPDGPFILSAVHRSFIDTPIVGVITGKRLRFMGKESLWNSRPLGAFLTFFGGFPVERAGVDRTALRAAEDVLRLGEPLVMFPEGTRQVGPRLERELMHDGPSFVASRVGVPIVPVGIGGSARALPVGAKIPRPHKVVVVIGTPIMPAAKVDGRVPRRAVKELTDRLFVELGDLYVEARVLAGDETTPV